MRRELVWQTLADCYAAAMTPLTPRVRYRITAALARPATRLLGRALLRRPLRFFYSTPFEETLRALLRTMARKGMTFDLEVHVDAPADLVETIKQRGAIMVSSHFPLNALVIRYLHDAGLPVTVIRAKVDDDPYVWGSSTIFDFLLPSNTILLTLRRYLRQGRPILMDIDRSAPFGRTVAVDSPFGVSHVSTPVFDFAKRVGVPVYFFCGRTNALRQPLVYVRSIEPTVDAFVDEMRQQTAALRAS